MDKNFFLNRKKVNTLIRYKWSPRYRFKKRWKKYSIIPPMIKWRGPQLVKIYKFFLLHRQLFRSVYMCLRDSSLKRIHKQEFKKDKKRLYINSFFLTLERRICSILYQVKLVSKLKILKNLIFNKRIFVNGLLRTGYSFMIKPLDFVYYSTIVTHDLKAYKSLNFFSSFPKNIYADGLFTKPILNILKFSTPSFLKALSSILYITLFKIKRSFYQFKYLKFKQKLIFWWNLFEKNYSSFFIIKDIFLKYQIFFVSKNYYFYLNFFKFYKIAKNLDFLGLKFLSYYYTPKPYFYPYYKKLSFLKFIISTKFLQF